MLLQQKWEILYGNYVHRQGTQYYSPEKMTVHLS